MRIQTHFFSMQFHHKINNNENGGQFMCGIIGYAGLCNISNSVLIEGLEALEYRGYDSAGDNIMFPHISLMLLSFPNLLGYKFQ